MTTIGDWARDEDIKAVKVLQYIYLNLLYVISKP